MIIVLDGGSIPPISTIPLEARQKWRVFYINLRYSDLVCDWLQVPG